MGKSLKIIPRFVPVDEECYSSVSNTNYLNATVFIEKRTK
jgi:hypothetical protein